METTVNGKKIYVVVDGNHRWFETMYAAFLKAALPVGDMSLFNQTLKVVFICADGNPLIFKVTPKSKGISPWKSTERFSVRYEGDEIVKKGHEKLFGLFFRVLSKFDSVMPPELSGFAYIGTPGKTPTDTVCKIFPFVTVEQSVVNGVPSTEVLARVTSACNQQCPFCSGPMHGTPSSEVVLSLLDTIGDTIPGGTVSFTGGEPTLRKSFIAEVARAIGHSSIKDVQIQTNAVNFARSIDPAVFPVSNKLKFFVSLHALDEQIYNRCVGTVGQFEAAVLGINRILTSGHPVILNTVISKENINHLVDFVGLVSSTFNGFNKPQLHFSTLICQEWNPNAEHSLIRYSDVIPVLNSVTQRMISCDFPVNEHLSSTHASMPVCFFYRNGEKKPQKMFYDGGQQSGYEDYSKPWIKAKRCVSCVWTAHCIGVPRSYAKKFGLDELCPKLKCDTGLAP